MLLSFRFLNDVVSVNSFETISAIEINSGDTQDLYIQLVDAALDRAEQGYSPAGRRYMPPATSTMTVTLVNTDTGPTIPGDVNLSSRVNPSIQSKVIRTATQPFAQDASIWKIPLLASDPLNGTVQIQLALAEPSRTLTVRSQPGLVLRVR